MLDLVGRGFTTREIASLLSISRRTVDFHVVNAMKKLGARTRREAAATAVRLGLVKSPIGRWKT